MQARTAWILGALAGGLAVAAVAADAAMGLTVRIEEQRDGAWHTVATSDRGRSYAFEPHCSGPDLRLVVESTLLWPRTVDVDVTAQNQSSQRREVLVDDTWLIDAGQRQSVEFTVPAESMRSPDGKPGPSFVEVRVGKTWISTCVEAA